MRHKGTDSASKFARSLKKVPEGRRVVENVGGKGEYEQLFRAMVEKRFITD